MKLDSPLILGIIAQLIGFCVGLVVPALGVAVTLAGIGYVMWRAKFSREIVNCLPVWIFISTFIWFPGLAMDVNAFSPDHLLRCLKGLFVTSVVYGAEFIFLRYAFSRS